jgi:hypothetical protein
MRVAEAQGELLAGVIKAVLADLGLSKDQQASAPRSSAGICSRWPAEGKEARRR